MSPNGEDFFFLPWLYPIPTNANIVAAPRELLLFEDALHLDACRCML